MPRKTTDTSRTVYAILHLPSMTVCTARNPACGMAHTMTTYPTMYDATEAARRMATTPADYSVITMTLAR